MDEEGLKEDYRKDGYFILKGILSQAEVTRLNALVEPIYRAWFRDNKDSIFEHKMLNMHSLTRAEYFVEDAQNRAKLFDAITHPKLTQVANKVFGEGLYFHNTQLFFNPSNPARQPYWHRDMQYSPVPESDLAAELESMLNLHFRIPFIKETGVELIPGTHHRWDTKTERNVRLELDGHENHEPLPGSKMIELEVGDVLVFNAQMLHRGNYALNPERKALDLCVGKYHKFTAPALEKACLPTPEELQKIQNKNWYQSAHDVVQKSALKPS